LSWSDTRRTHQPEDVRAMRACRRSLNTSTVRQGRVQPIRDDSPGAWRSGDFVHSAQRRPTGSQDRITGRRADRVRSCPCLWTSLTAGMRARVEGLFCLTKLFDFCKTRAHILAMETKTAHLGIRLTQSQKQRATEAAAKEGKRLSDFTVSALLRAVVKAEKAP
jgi:hypothetical protein